MTESSVREHNEVMPRLAFHGLTPDEVFFSRSRDIPDELEAAHRQARVARLEANRNLRCHDCRAAPATGDPSQAVALAQQKAA